MNTETGLVLFPKGEKIFKLDYAVYFNDTPTEICKNTVIISETYHAADAKGSFGNYLQQLFSDRIINLSISSCNELTKDQAILFSK